MVIIMRMGASTKEIGDIIQRIEDQGFKAHPVYGVERTIIGVVGDDRPRDPTAYEVLSGVERVMRVLHPFKLAGRDFHPENTAFRLNGMTVGGDALVVIAGPFAVESREQILETAEVVKAAGVKILRGGAFKPRTSPYSFQGLGEYGLKLLAEARQATGLLIATEVVSTRDVPLVAEYADILQIGARNMQNYALLHAVGEARRPVLLKRGLMSTIEELLMAAEYILSHGNNRVMLCERGIRTFEKYTRNTLDINAVPALKQLSHLPVIVDPSHGTGKWDLVHPISMAAIAAGADGLIIEVHPHPEDALSDGAQSLRPENFARLMDDL
ncbi:MAG: 3-deoxy-7-phosphoheptulonate synthase, partial [Chloroflexi bacterium RBG_16_57_9]